MNVKNRTLFTGDNLSVRTRPVFLVLVFLCMVAAHAQQDTPGAPPIDPTLSDEQLRFRLWTGCQPMGLSVEALSDDAAKIGLTREALQNAAESRLRAARLYTDNQSAEFLGINVAVIGPAFHISVNFYKRVLDQRVTARMLSKMWDSMLDSLDSPEETKELLNAMISLGLGSDSETVQVRTKILSAWKLDIDSIRYPWAPLGSSAETWSSGSTGTHGRNSSFILGAVSKHLDKFLVEFLRVNESDCSGAGPSTP